MVGEERNTSSMEMGKVDRGGNGCFPRLGRNGAGVAGTGARQALGTCSQEGCCQGHPEPFQSGVQETRVDSRAEPQHEEA